MFARDKNLRHVSGQIMRFCNTLRLLLLIIGFESIICALNRCYDAFALIFDFVGWVLYAVWPGCCYHRKYYWYFFEILFMMQLLLWILLLLHVHKTCLYMFDAVLISMVQFDNMCFAGLMHTSCLLLHGKCVLFYVLLPSGWMVVIPLLGIARLKFL